MLFGRTFRVLEATFEALWVILGLEGLSGLMGMPVGVLGAGGKPFVALWATH